MGVKTSNLTEENPRKQKNPKEVTRPNQNITPSPQKFTPKSDQPPEKGEKVVNWQNLNKLVPEGGEKMKTRTKTQEETKQQPPPPPPPTIPALENPVLSSVNSPEETQKTSAQAQKNAFKMAT